MPASSITDPGTDVEELAESGFATELNWESEVLGDEIEFGDCRVSPIAIPNSLGEVTNDIAGPDIKELGGWPGQGLVQGVGPVANGVGAYKSVFQRVTVTIDIVANASEDAGGHYLGEVLELEAEGAKVCNVALLFIKGNPCCRSD